MVGLSIFERSWSIEIGSYRYLRKKPDVLYLRRVSRWYRGGLAFLELWRPGLEHYLYNIKYSSASIQVLPWMSMIMICLCLLWIVFLIIYHVYGPLNSITVILILKCNYPLYFQKTKAISLHDFMIVVTKIMNFVSCFMLYGSCMISWFSYSFDWHTNLVLW